MEKYTIIIIISFIFAINTFATAENKAAIVQRDIYYMEAEIIQKGNQNQAEIYQDFIGHWALINQQGYYNRGKIIQNEKDGRDHVTDLFQEYDFNFSEVNQYGGTGNEVSIFQFCDNGIIDIFQYHGEDNIIYVYQSYGFDNEVYISQGLEYNKDKYNYKNQHLNNFIMLDQKGDNNMVQIYQSNNGNNANVNQNGNKSIAKVTQY